jgi:peptidoglycan hydrolase-like protein with peptidoglycan-binding domain/3D (Asp-Asp-Asp) domain-containing protein
MTKTNIQSDFELVLKVGTMAMLSIIMTTLATCNLAYAAETADTSDTDVPQTLSTGEIHTVTSDKIGYDPTDNFPVQKTFIISAYYSPVPGQTKYVTGSYSGDIKLNGGGVHGADGTNVYPGMIAAPKSYPFGTKLDIPGIGTVAVHDRGGAIVHTGERGNAYDRLDVWMGFGDAGLYRALHWGKRTVTAMVYGVNPSIEEKVYLEGYSDTEKNNVTQNIAFDDNKTFEQTPTVQEQPTVSFEKALSYGMVDADVGKMQAALKSLNYYDGEIQSVFDENTLNAVKKFQVSEKIVGDVNDYGAGYVGPKTIKILASKVNIGTVNAASDNFVPQSVFSGDLKPGDNSEDVRKLQLELKKLNLFGADPTGNYGDTTEHAVFKFQQISMLAGDKNSIGAGIFGQKTRTAMNLIIAERERINKLREENA